MLTSPASRCFVLSLCALISTSVSSAKAPSNPPLNAHYIAALATADRFLQAWQSGDAESGIVLLSSRARKNAGPDRVADFFSNPGPCGYELGRGKLLKRGRYEFPVVFVGGGATHHLQRRFSTLAMVESGGNDWAVDKLP